MKKTILIVLAVLLFLVAAGVTAYPLISNYVNDKYQSLVLKDYAKNLEAVDTSEIEAARAAAEAYNNSLSPLHYSKEAVDEAAQDYDTLLNLDGSGMMGTVEIPLISVNLPIYHGTGEAVLEEGIGHLVGSSLPIGGEGCHAVLTGHSGVPGKRLFSDIDQLKPGDVFYLHILGETLAYQVTETNTVLPHETELLAPVSGEDLCTLVTCYPYGVNTHRLLVRGSRIPYEEAAEIVEETSEDAPTVKSTWKEQYFQGLKIGGIAAVGALGIGLLLSRLLRHRKRGKFERY